MSDLGSEVLVLRHHPDEGPGALGPLLARAGMHLTLVDTYLDQPLPPLEGYDVMLAMGGPMDVWEEVEHPWLVAEKAAIRRWVAVLGRPYLGVCLGHQLLAAALGGVVAPMAGPEIGVVDIALTAAGASDPALGRLPANVPGLEWHGAEVVSLPPGGTALAGNERSAIQALRVGDRAYGVQFHLEVEASTIATWAAVPEYRDALVVAGCGGSSWLEGEVTRRLPSMAAAAELLVDGLLAGWSAAEVAT